jgi:hypothetical protein
MAAKYAGSSTYLGLRPIHSNVAAVAHPTTAKVKEASHE